jgi:shikimate dehydrogenase
MRTYGLIGFPLSHSFSRAFFTEKFVRENKNEQYLNFEIDKITLFPGIVINHPELAGLNVTIPYKQQVIPFLDGLDTLASVTGAVNTIRIRREPGRIFTEGYNTDVFGFTESIRPLLKPWHRSALILGTGGAAKAVVYSFNQMGINWMQVSRNPSGGECISYEMIDRALLEEFTVVVNTTPLGTFPDTNSCPAIPYRLLTGKHLLFDLVYNPPVTRFLENGAERGAVVRNGREMLELQALKSYGIWNSLEE